MEEAHLGAHSRESVNQHERSYKVTQVILHPQYNNGPLPDNDIALLVLQSDVEFTRRIYPICIPSHGDYFIGQKAQVVGWGLTNYDDSIGSDTPKTAIVEILNDIYECQRVQGYELDLDLTRVCAKPITGKTCMGDSGSPLMCVDEETRKIKLCGIVSGGNIGCNDRDQKPAYYTRATAFREWIRQNTDIDELCSQGYQCQSDICLEFSALRTVLTERDYEDFVQERRCGSEKNKFCCKQDSPKTSTIETQDDSISDTVTCEHGFTCKFSCDDEKDADYNPRSHIAGEGCQDGMVCCEERREGNHSYLMIVGGWNGSYVDTVELMSLSPDNPIPECLTSPRGNFPKRISGAVGMTLEGRVIVCGGRGTNYVYADGYSTCWAYDAAEDKWTEDGQMQEKGVWSADALSPKYGWVISGGLGDGLKKLSSVKHSHDARNFQMLTPMPIALDSHCLVSLGGNTGELFVAGGVSAGRLNDKTYILKDGVWEEKEKMPTARNDVKCGPVRSQVGGPVDKIVVSGLYGEVSTVEVYDVQKDSWERADGLPFGKLSYGATIPFEDTFLIIGGRIDGHYSNKVWRYKKNGKWEEMRHLQLREGKRRLTAIEVPSNIFPEC